MLSRLYSVTVEGIEGVLCEVEVDVSRGGFERPVIVGLPDTAVKESVERVRSAVINSGFRYPDTQSLINLAPADVKKVGPAFDLPIALGILACSGALSPEALRDYVVIGELALDGRVRPVTGVLSMAMTAAAGGFSKMIVPLDNAREAAVVKDIEVFPVGSLAQTAALLSGQLPIEPTTVDLEALFAECGTYETDFADVKGQESVKRALTIAAAGGHNLMMIGPPGAGKTMLAQRMATILPPMTLPESLETTQIYSAVGLLPKDKALIAARPVRAPHHTASGPSLVGGGTHPRPGELSLAHHGILFLDEFAEFPRHVLEMIRQPLEEGQVTVSRAKGTLRFPARFILIAAMNPCPCGYFGTSMRRCRCTPTQIERYMAKISGPLMDRMDIHIDVPPVEFRKLRSRRSGDGSAQIRLQVQQARQIQRQRFGHPFMTNAAMGHKQVEQFCTLDSTSEMMLRQAMTEFALSARAHDKICKVARTIADLEGAQNIQPAHIAEAVGYRKLDRKL
ncbi:MAG TPA: YifB family Mg chelatase-like AAA ATPase [Anaerohalosphaeraceae bacterium]|nr:YifB family Mg chelatase-like AAA ATPase [Anaerohalosphaeraceae bacterium]HOL87797.1 YifB family Mg chelatase-like AAA ATPase [Anaerohalosphaeraceae bacterium]HPP55149.1 YifB family Mg chelatase-like AAA ATPase [Anaerohalosphaeraceae bacterium]